MQRMRACAVVMFALVAPGALAAGGGAVTADTFDPGAERPAAASHALLESVLTDTRPGPHGSPEVAARVGALLDPSGTTFSPRPQFVVRPEVAPQRDDRHGPGAPVPAPAAAALLALAGACAPRRRPR